MNVQTVSIRPTKAAEEAGRPSLTPELLAATGARYSRNNEGLDAILANIDWDNPDKSVDGIFKMIDYGHQSIADMVPVAMYIDGISEWLAFVLFGIAPTQTAGAQQSSTRYIPQTIERLVDPEILGIPSELRDKWWEHMQRAYAAYDQSLVVWGQLLESNPKLSRIPESLLLDPSDKAKKKVERMMRNYAFDRARVNLPVCGATNMVLIMSARSWVGLCQFLLSSPLPEAQQLAPMIIAELNLQSPRMTRHATFKESEQARQLREFGKLQHAAPAAYDDAMMDGQTSLEIFLPSGVTEEEIVNDLVSRDNRYALPGSAICRTSVRFAWNGVDITCARDLNRHRTGTKYCPPLPVGFYSAIDECPEGFSGYNQLANMSQLGHEANRMAHNQLLAGDHTYPYWLMMGSQLPFEHTTTGDKFVYEAELRTGDGSHYRYAKHLHDALELLYAKLPGTRGVILEGSAEPE